MPKLWVNECAGWKRSHPAGTTALPRASPLEGEIGTRPRKSSAAAAALALRRITCSPNRSKRKELSRVRLNHVFSMPISKRRIRRLNWSLFKHSVTPAGRKSTPQSGPHFHKRPVNTPQHRRHPARQRTALWAAARARQRSRTCACDMLAPGELGAMSPRRAFSPHALALSCLTDSSLFHDRPSTFPQVSGSVSGSRKPQGRSPRRRAPETEERAWAEAAGRVVALPEVARTSRWRPRRSASGCGRWRSPQGRFLACFPPRPTRIVLHLATDLAVWKATVRPSMARLPCVAQAEQGGVAVSRESEERSLGRPAVHLGAR